MSHPKHSAISAPGKVLLAGGYLVLDRDHTGLVFGLSARIHVVVQQTSQPAAAAPPQQPLIVVHSPQFIEAEWRYAHNILPDGRGVEITQLESPAGSRNPFVETALAYALTYLTTLPTPPTIPSLHITILADNDYYSQPSSLSASTTTTPSPFQNFSVRLSAAHKTGLGSSAALTTALTSALLTSFIPTPPLPLLHNLSQAAHCAAQGKIGSGFDVAAAVHGSCLYRRFSPSVLSSISDASGPGTDGFAARLRAVVDGDVHWDTQIAKGPAVLPSGYALVMCDVDCGSQTVGMVKQVLAWRKASASAAARLWASLQTANEGLAAALAGGDEGAIRTAFAGIRGLIREMGDQSGVPIEPQAQTELLDALGAVEGVVGGVVPGAGGYDAVALLIRDDEQTLARVNAFLRDWSASHDGAVKLLGVKGEMEGLRHEDSFDYGSWIN